MGEYEDKLKGKATQIKADITGNAAEHAKGAAIEQRGRMKGAFERVKNAAKDLLSQEKGEKHR